jgi:hypothetical protein
MIPSRFVPSVRSLSHACTMWLHWRACTNPTCDLPKSLRPVGLACPHSHTIRPPPRSKSPLFSSRPVLVPLPVLTLPRRGCVSTFPFYSPSLWDLLLSCDGALLQNLSQYFDSSNAFISKARGQGGSVYVHCYAGLCPASPHHPAPPPPAPPLEIRLHLRVRLCLLSLRVCVQAFPEHQLW